MTDNKENRKSFEEFIAETVERQYSMDAPKTITAQELEERLQKRKAQRRMRRLKTVGFAAIFVIAVLCTSIGFNTLTTNVGADKNDKEEFRTEDGVVIEDGGYGGSSEDSWVTSDWNDIEVYKVSIPQLITFEYVPEDYIFYKLVVMRVETGATTCEYIFTDNKNKATIEIEQFIQEEGEMYFEVDNTSREIKHAKSTIYIQDVNNKKIATMRINDGIYIKIWAVVPDEEIIKIIDGITY